MTRQPKPAGFDPAAVNAWARQVERNLNLVERIYAADPGQTFHGQQWKDGMLRHYRARVNELLRQAPAGCDRVVKRFKERLDKVVDP